MFNASSKVRCYTFFFIFCFLLSGCSTPKEDAPTSIDTENTKTARYIVLSGSMKQQEYVTLLQLDIKGNVVSKESMDTKGMASAIVDQVGNTHYLIETPPAANIFWKWTKENKLVVQSIPNPTGQDLFIHTALNYGVEGWYQLVNSHITGNQATESGYSASLCNSELQECVEIRSNCLLNATPTYANLDGSFYTTHVCGWNNYEINHFDKSGTLIQTVLTTEEGRFFMLEFDQKPYVMEQTDTHLRFYDLSSDTPIEIETINATSAITQGLTVYRLGENQYVMEGSNGSFVSMKKEEKEVVVDTIVPDANMGSTITSIDSVNQHIYSVGYNENTRIHSIVISDYAMNTIQSFEITENIGEDRVFFFTLIQ